MASISRRGNEVMTWRRIRMLAALLVLGIAPAAGARAAEAPAIEEARLALNGGRLADAAAALDSRLRESPDDDSARLALGGVQFMQAAERLGQSLYRHGLEPSP